MRVLVTGASGQLGKDLMQHLNKRYEMFGFDRNEMDITDLDQCSRIIEQVKPDVVIHAAAFTAVDLAESEPDTAFKINAVGSRNVALAAKTVGAKVCYISTDYVFDGSGVAPYNEFDQTNPTGVYGKSKRAGEMLVQTICDRYFIVRTSWVYGIHGNNFVKTMLRLGKEKNQLKVVHDQVGSPTYTLDLCCFLADLIETDYFGIYHASNSGHCSWYDFAKAIFEESGIRIHVDPCTTEEFPRPAPRPRYSVMDHMFIRTNGFAELPFWRDALRVFLKELGEQKCHK